MIERTIRIPTEPSGRGLGVHPDDPPGGRGGGRAVAEEGALVTAVISGVAGLCGSPPRECEHSGRCCRRCRAADCIRAQGVRCLRAGAASDLWRDSAAVVGVVACIQSVGADPGRCAGHRPCVQIAPRGALAYRSPPGLCRLPRTRLSPFRPAPVVSDGGRQRRPDCMGAQITGRTDAPPTDPARPTEHSPRRTTMTHRPHGLDSDELAQRV
jgi:hypothetical protein